MADDKKQQPAGPSGGDPKVAPNVTPAKEQGKHARGTSTGTGASTATAPGGR